MNQTIYKLIPKIVNKKKVSELYQFFDLNKLFKYFCSLRNLNTLFCLKFRILFFKF